MTRSGDYGVPLSDFFTLFFLGVLSLQLIVIFHHSAFLHSLGMHNRAAAVSEFLTLRIQSVQVTDNYGDITFSAGCGMGAAFSKSSLRRKGLRRRGVTAVQP